MIRDGVAIPDKIKNKPKINTALSLYYEAFYDLDTERSHGMGLTSIPWSAIVFYASHYELNTDELLYFIRKMDTAHLERLAREMKSGSNFTKPSKPNG